MTDKKHYTADELMKMPLKDWPEPLQEYFLLIQNDIGFSGDMLYECAEEWVNAGQPERVVRLYLSKYGR